MFHHMRSPSPKSKRKSRTLSRFKTTVEVVHGIRIREIRSGYYFIRMRRDGQRFSGGFASLEAARLKCEQLHQERVRNGLSAFELDTKTRIDAADAVKLLGGRASLTDAARLWLDHNPDGGAVLVSEIGDKYLLELARKNSRPITLIDARTRVARFVADHGSTPVTLISPAVITEWLSVRGGNAVNANNSRKWLHAMFGFALKQGIIKINPVTAVEPIPVEPKLPEHWDAGRVEPLMRAAQLFNPPMVPMLAIMAFAGLRPHEAALLEWQDVNLVDKIIRIRPGTSKVRQARVVEMSDNLAAWLVPYRKKTGRIAPTATTIARWRTRLAAAAVVGVDEVRRRLLLQTGKKGTSIKAERLGWSNIISDAQKQSSPLWIHDILRHSCATAWLAKNSDIFKLAEMLGNSPDVIRRHYKGLMTAKEADAYWSIYPSNQQKIIQLAG